MKVKFNKSDPGDTQIHIPKKDTTVSVGVEALGEGRFRLMNFPIGACPWLTFGDVIEATPLPDGALEFIRRVEKSPYKTYEFILSKEFAESKPLSRVLAQIMELGGYWERVFTGVLLIAVPTSAEWDPTPHIDRASAEWRS